MTEYKAIENIKYRIATASKIAGKGADGKALEDLEVAIEALEKISKIKEITDSVTDLMYDDDVACLFDKIKEVVDGGIKNV